MNRQVSHSKTSSSAAAQSGAGVNAPTLAQTATVSMPAYDELVSEKRAQWLFRVQICLILSFLAHVGLLFYLHDKFIPLNVSLTDKNNPSDLERERLVPMPVREPKSVSQYDDNRLDSPQIRDSFEQLTPTSPAEEQEFIDEKKQPSVDELSAEFDHEYQTPDSPELSDVPNVTPIEINELETPSEEVQPDVSRTYNTQFNPGADARTVPLPESDVSLKTVEHEQPESDFASLPQPQSAMPDFSNVALDVGEAESNNPAVDPTVFNIQSDDALPEVNNHLPEQVINPLSFDLFPPKKSVRPNVYHQSTDNAILARSTYAIPQSQAGKPVSEKLYGGLGEVTKSSKINNNQAAEAVSSSIIPDSPPSLTSVSVPYDANAGFGGLNGDEFRSVNTPPESTVSFVAPSIVPLRHSDAAPSEAYKIRDPKLRPQIIAQYHGDKNIEQTIENGLKYLSKTQWPDGRWRFHQQPSTLKVDPKLQQNGNLQCDTAATSLALLTMLGAGYTHKDGQYKEEIRKGLWFLIDRQQTIPVHGTNQITGAVGALFNKESDTDLNSCSYAHALATIALCEAYGLTHDPEILPAAQLAVRYIIATQNPFLGGWRYETAGQEGQPHKESDTSSSGWQVLALRTAMTAEVLPLDELTPALNNAQRWLKRAQNPSDKRYIYNPDNGTDSKFSNWKETTPSMTAEGLYMQYCINPDLADAQQIIPYLMRNLPGEPGDSAYIRDVYYWYYGTAVMFIQQDENWNKWQSTIMPYLQRTQLSSTHQCAGSWDVEQPTVDKWSNIGGKHYLTTMNLIILEVYFRHLSIYH